MTTSLSQDRHVLNLRRITDPVLQDAGFDLSRVQHVVPKLGRNISGIYDFGDDQYFVKAIVGMYADERFKRSMSFFTANLDLPAVVSSPSLVHDDPGTHTAVFECVDEHSRLSEVASENAAPHALLDRVGRALAGLHHAPIDHPDRIDTATPGLPPVADAAIPLDLVEGSTMGQLDLWRILQSDHDLGARLAELVQQPFRPAPIHGDLRTDQILYSDDHIWIIDWEDFRLGDPARDLGALLGEILYHRLRQLATRAADDHADLTDESIMRAGVELVELARPSLSRTWLGYLAIRHSQSDQLPDQDATAAFRGRVIGYIGWQMFDRAMAIGTYLGRITAFERALIGIGRQLIVLGDAYREVLGLRGETT